MRLHFSLRTFFILVTFLAGFCYFWFVMPTATANRLVAAVAAQDYAAADRLFRVADYRYIASSAETYWAFDAKAELLPITIGQLLTGQRYVLLHIDYFYLDQNVSTISHIPATPFGLNSPTTSRVASAVVIDRGSSSDVRRIR